MDAVSSSTLMTSERRREQQVEIADAARRELTGAWLAVRPRRRMIEVLRIEALGVGDPQSRPPSV